MKYIKKVDVTQLVTNTGTIIDSMSSGDDQHTNAPSINAVKNYVENYSTTEQRIGTWTDGKPLYRKVIEGTVSTISNLCNAILNHKFVSIHGYAQADNGVYMQSDNSFDGSGFRWTVWWETHHNVSFSFGSEFSDSNLVVVIVEYTKTTD